MKQDTLLILCSMGCLAFLAYTYLKKSGQGKNNQSQSDNNSAKYGTFENRSEIGNEAIEKIFKNIQLFNHYESSIIPKMYTKTKQVIEMITKLNIQQIECFNENEKQRILQQESKLLPLNPGEKPQIVQAALKLQMEIKDLANQMTFYLPQEDEPITIWNTNVSKLMEIVHYYVSQIHEQCRFLFVT